MIIAGIDTLNDRREALTERLFKRRVLASSVHFFTICFQIGAIIMTVLIVSDIRNHFTNCGVVPLDFATASYLIS